MAASPTILRVGNAVVCAAPVLAFLAVWQLASLAAGSESLPGVGEVAWTFVTHALADPVIRSQGGGEAGFLPHVAATVVHVAVGVGVGAGLGVAIALLLLQSRRARQLFEPLIEALRVIPPLILIPFVLVALGPTEAAQFLVCGLYAGLSMLVHALNAAENLPAEYAVIARLHGAGRWQTLRTMTLPGALPELLGGLRISLAVALGIVVVSEYLGAPSGLGRVLKFSVSFARTDLVLVGLLWATLIGLAFDTLIGKIVLPRIGWRA